jgi:dihydroorotase
MTTLIKNGQVWQTNKFVHLDILVNNGKITKLAKHIDIKTTKIIDAKGLFIIPGLIDVHVHLREPGYEYKETIKTGSKAALLGGYTTICCMPNTNPVIDNLSVLNKLKKIIRHDAYVNVKPYVSITKAQKGKTLVDMPLLGKHCFAFSDDGVGIQSSVLMLKAMQMCAKINKPIVTHCEDATQTSNAREYKEVSRNLQLALKSKCQLHICHVSTKESIALIKKVKNKLISCEVTPHHLLLNHELIKDNGNYKMNPPLASKKDQIALCRALIDGTIDMIATDHAPHSKNEKNTTYAKSLNGVVGLEIAFSLIYTKFVKTHKITFKRLIELMSINPAKVFGIRNNEIKINHHANFAIVDLNKK